MQECYFPASRGTAPTCECGTCVRVCVCVPYQSLLATKGLPLSSSSTDAEPILPSPSEAAAAAAAEADKSDVGFDE